MKKEMETVYKNKDNVVYTISNDLNSCYDIDVPDDVETVMLGIREDETIRTGALILAFNLVKSEKSFPNVKKLIIGSHIFHISIPNALFPNVREVISYSKHFDSGKYIVHLTDSYSPMKLLYNSFCLGPDEVLNLEGIHLIEANALEGCQTTKVINANKTKILDRQALHGSAFEQLKAGHNQCLLLGNFVIGVDENAEELEIPSDILGVISGINIDHVHRLVVHDIDMVSRFCGVPDILVLAKDVQTPSSRITPSKLGRLGKMIFEVEKGNAHLKAVDGVLYSKYGTFLYRVPETKTGHFIVPDGVETIFEYAFANSKIDSVSFPDSLKKIKRHAFEDCEYLKDIDFGNGIEVIGLHKSRMYDSSVFNGCSSLKHVTFPKQIKEIGRMAFKDSGLEKVELNEGLKLIGEAAFAYCKIKTLRIPASVYDVDYMAFAGVDYVVFENESMTTSAAFALITEQIGTVHVTAGNESIYIMSPTMKECLDGSVRTMDDMKRFAEEKAITMAEFLIKKDDSNGFKKMLEINDYCYDTLKSILDNIQIDNAVCMAYLMDKIEKKREAEDEFSM